MPTNVETAKEVGGRRRGRLVLRTVIEEDDFTMFHSDLVEHNTDDGMDEIKDSQEDVKAHPQKPRRLSPWRLQGCQVKNIPIENTTKVETDCIQGDGHHARFPHLVAEAGSIVLHVSNNMNEVKKDDEDSEDGEEEGETAAARED